jgi:entericidin A
MKKAFALVLLAIAGVVLTACNTVHGFGRDVEKVGEKMQGKSKDKD